MPTSKERGPHSNTVNEGEKLGNTKFSSAKQPNLNLKSNPNSDVERAFKSVKFPTEGTWGTGFKLPPLPKG